MRRQLKFKEKKAIIISNKRLDKDEFITDSLFHFSEKNEYEIHLLEKLLEANKETNQLLRKLVDEDEPDNRSLKDKALDLFDDGKINRSNVKKSSKKDRK